MFHLQAVTEIEVFHVPIGVQSQWPAVHRYAGSPAILQCPSSDDIIQYAAQLANKTLTVTENHYAREVGEDTCRTR